MGMTAEGVGECYREARKAFLDGGGAPGRNTWWAASLGELALIADVARAGGLDKIEAAAPDGCAGDYESEAVAWVFASDGSTLYKVTSTATRAEVLDLFAWCLHGD